jgi:nucleoside-diphosphate-sugar epimerase
MKNILIFGATGMIGNLILEKSLHDDGIRLVTSITRQKSGQNHPKLREIIHHDFTDFLKLEHYFRDQDVLYYCLGVYTGQASREEFRKITVDFTKTVADTLKRNSPDATFCFLSGQGADISGKSKVPFARDKGLAENVLIQLNFMKLYIFRPAYIYPETPRKEPNVMYRFMRVAYPLVKRIVPSSVITSKQLAHAMFTTALNGNNPQTILENRQIREIALNLSID